MLQYKQILNIIDFHCYLEHFPFSDHVMLSQTFHWQGEFGTRVFSNHFICLQGVAPGRRDSTKMETEGSHTMFVSAKLDSLKSLTAVRALRYHIFSVLMYSKHYEYF